MSRPLHNTSDEKWPDYFERNRHRLMAIPWDAGVAWSVEERDAVAASLQEFQLGESGEGRHFKMCAARYSARTGDDDYVRALDLFIAEEQRHAHELGRVLDLAGVERLTDSAVNSAFCRLRRLAGLELIIVVLVTAELVAQVYYKALFQATSSPVLKALCRQILRDEVQHVRFQCSQLAKVRRHRFGWVNSVCVALHFLLLMVTAVVVWRRHGRVMRRSGIGRFAFVRQLAQKFAVARPWMTVSPSRPAINLQSRKVTDTTAPA
ncbi:MAG TPA: ferritin-like domain-containing protein [Tepidisphaeraceae bacterium]